MFKKLGQICWPYKKMLGWALIALGALLLILFVPAVVWLAIIGVLFVVAGLYFLLV